MFSTFFFYASSVNENTFINNKNNSELKFPIGNTPDGQIPANILEVYQDSAHHGESFVMTLNAEGTSFYSGALEVILIGVNDTIVGTMANAMEDSILTVDFTIPNNVSYGDYDVQVYDDADSYITMTNGFTIYALPGSIETIDPTIGHQDHTELIDIVGLNTHFDISGGCTVWLSGKDSVGSSSNNYTSSTEMDAEFYFNSDDSLGLYDLHIENTFDTLVKTNCFELRLNPTIKSFTPDNARQGDTVMVTIIGNNTNFTQSSIHTMLTMNMEGDDLIVAFYNNVVDDTTLESSFYIPETANIDMWNLEIESNIDGLIEQMYAFTINPPPAYIISVSPNSSVQGDVVSIDIEAKYSRFLQGSTPDSYMIRGLDTLQSSSVSTQSDTIINVNFSIPANAKIGFYDVHTNSQNEGELIKHEAFYLDTNGARIISIEPEPTPTAQGDNVSMTINTLKTKLSQGSTPSGYISMDGDTIDFQMVGTDNDSLMNVEFTIPLYTAAGLWDVTIYSDSDGYLVRPRLFDIQKAPAQIISINPDSAFKGQNLSVTVIGFNTNFISDTTYVYFDNEMGQINPNSLTVISDTEIVAYFTIPKTAGNMQYDVIVNDSIDGNIYLANAITIYELPPLSGTKTIDSAGSGPDNYTSFTQAINAMIIRGIDNPIKFRVASDIYNEQITIPTINGTSFANTITFESASGNNTDVVIQYSSNSVDTNWILCLDSTNNVIFNNIKLVALSPSYGRVVEFRNGSSFNEIDSCSLHTNSGVSLNDNHIGIYSNSMDCSNNIISNNYIYGGSSGIYWKGSTTTPNRSNVFLGNDILEFNSNGIYVSYCDSTIISDNTINYNNPSGSPSGIYIDNNDGGVQVINNRVYMVANSYYSGIFFNGASTGVRSLIANNFVSCKGGMKTYGIRIYQATLSDIYNNSVYVEGDSSAACIIHENGVDVNFENNIAYMLGSGYSLYITTPNNVSDADFNCLYSSGSKLAFWGGIRTDLSALQTASGKFTNSISVLPDFTSTTDLHLSSYVLNNQGKVLTRISTDIDGEVRDTLNPDIGADEFTPSPLSGVKTIDAAGSGPDNYISFNNAVEALKSQGIDNNIIFNVASGIYNEQVSIPYINGVEEDYSILFQSATHDSSDVIISYAPTSVDSNYTLQFDSAQSVTLKHLNIRSEGVSFGRVVDISKYCDGVNIYNCIIEGSDNTIADQEFENIYIDSIASFLEIKNNRFIKGTHSITSYGDLNYLIALIVTDNTFDDIVGNIIDLNYSVFFISHNTFNVNSSTPSNSTTINLNTPIQDTSYFSSNKVNCSVTISNAIDIRLMGQGEDVALLVDNNFITMQGGGEAINIKNAANINVLHNSILLTGNHPASSCISIGDTTIYVI
ncbi:MAG: hypothetical protein DRI86_12145, partial [Bacteroidetes bacterium]